MICSPSPSPARLILVIRSPSSLLRSNLLVHDMQSESVTSTLDLGDQVTQLLDSFHLLTEELTLDEVTEMSISLAVTGLLEIKKTLVDCFFQLKSSLHGLKWSAPLHAAGLGNILEDDTSSSLGLVLHQLHPVITLLIRALLEEGGKSRKSLVITVEVRCHGQVDIAGVELHVDLLVDESLALLVVVLPDLGSHDAIEEKVVEKVVIADCSTLSGVAIVPAVCLTVGLLLRI